MPALLLAAVALASGAQTPAPAPATPRALAIANKPWTGDLDALVERRMVRVLVPYSRSLYFNDGGTERGITADLVREFEQYLNAKYRKGKRPITVYIVPTTRDRLIDGVAEGLGDIAAGNLTI
ncbi:MAG TPA: hypothetical protein VFL14_16690, partial [Xanthomonadales bacterium]|nr:hypothetical protein [Xanthomonadales bacterium]